MKKTILAALVAASVTALIAPAAATAAPADDRSAAALSDVRTREPAGAKTRWPETVGLPRAWARRVILRDRPGLRVVYLPEGALVTMEYDENRVRVFHDPYGIVTQAPTVG
ncbi:serine protease inhibitor [Streptomyces sp. NPDC001744]|uniref:serine protease inhibitor n=1 Tax=Streptomyces sp. NPDC001744 TaxID=3364606 RepID=UPI0036BFCE7C